MKASEYLAKHMHMDCIPHEIEANSINIYIKLENGNCSEILSETWASDENFAPRVFGSPDFEEFDKRFVDSHESTMPATVFGLKLEKIQKMIDFFKKNNFNPEDKNFERELDRREIK